VTAIEEFVEYPENDQGNGQRFVMRERHRTLYVPALGWHVWDGRRWQYDQSEKKVRKAAHKVVEKIYDESKHADNPTKRTKFAVLSGGSARISGMLMEAKPYLTVELEELDANPWLFNVENGTIDLSTGKLNEHDPEDRITKLAPVTFDEDATRPIFDEFLKAVLPDEELREFIQCFAGHSLSGDTREQCLAFLYGTGANGKSTLLDPLKRLLGDYGTTLPFASLLLDNRRQGGAASPDIASLPGVRMVLASEPDVGVRFSEALLKSMTGGDTISARKLHKDFFEFKPEAKLWLAGNHKPNIKGNDEGIWRRIRIVPFQQTFKEDDRDPELPGKLWEERAGILNWMLEGCLKWQREGLPIPEAVTEATQEYRTENDPIGEFFEDCVVVDNSANVRSADLYQRYTQYSEDNGLSPVSQKAFAQILKERGFQSEKVGVKFWRGLRLVDIQPSMVQPEYSNNYNRIDDVC